MRHARKDYDRIQDPTNKIGQEEPVFLLRAKDKFAPTAVRCWASLVAASGDQELADSIHNYADDMEAWGKVNGCKTPDTPADQLKDHSQEEKTPELIGKDLMRYERTTEVIIDLIDHKLDPDCSKITPEHRFIEDLGADSMDHVELIMGIEEHFNISINDDDAQDIITVKHLIDQTYKRVIA